MDGDLPRVEGVEHRFVEARGVRFHVAEAGSGPPVLLLHGWPQHWYMWRHVIARMRASHRLIAPDLRGFGWSEAPGEGYDGETFAADAVALLDELGIERALVLGHDWGGWTAMLLGLLEPGRVERMVVLNAPHPWPRIGIGLLPELWRSWYTWVSAAPLLGPWAVRRAGLAKAILNRGNVHEPFEPGEVDLYLERLREPERARATSLLYRYYQRALADGLRRRWRSRRLTVPALILFGARDRYLSPKLLAGGEGHADELAIELVPDSGHFIANEKPDLVAGRALDFFAKAEPRRR